MLSVGHLKKKTYMQAMVTIIVTGKIQFQRPTAQSPGGNATDELSFNLAARSFYVDLLQAKHA